jgi:hypothetical protein
LLGFFQNFNFSDQRNLLNDLVESQLATASYRLHWYCCKGVDQMTRYFFDVVGRGHSELDYSGQLCSTLACAHDAAELIAFDLAVKSESEAIGWAVTVSSADGRKLFSVPVHTSCLAAA